MSVRAISMALHLTGISTRAKLVMIGLCDCANDDSFTCYPSRKHLASIGDCSVDTVDRALKELADVLLIDRQPQFADDNDRIPTVNLYRVFPTFDPSRKTAATPHTPSRNIAQGVTAEMRLPSPHSYAPTVAAQDAATKEPSLEPYAVAAIGGREVMALVDEALAIASGAANLTSADVHHGRVFRQLLAAGCTRDDVIDAVTGLSAAYRERKRTFHSWAVVTDVAQQNRDKRITGLAPPRPEEPRRFAASAESPTAIVQRLAREGRI